MSPAISDHRMTQNFKEVIKLSKNMKHNALKLMNTEDNFYIQILEN